MAKAKYWQKGENLDYKNTGNTAIGAGDVVALTGRISVALTTIAPNTTGAVAVTGVWTVPKTGENAISMGQDVYWDGAGITDAADNGESGEAKVVYPLVGYAAYAETASATEIKVKLKG